MTLEQLTDIIKIADKEQITKQLKELGYTYCNEDNKLGKTGIVELIHAVEFETEDFVDKRRKRLFNGRMCRKVKDYENYEFVYVNVFDVKPSTDPFDDEETAIQTSMEIFAKEIEK